MPSTEMGKSEGCRKFKGSAKLPTLVKVSVDGKATAGCETQRFSIEVREGASSV